MKKGEKMKPESILKIKEARKRQGANVWNAGLRYSIYDEPSSVRFRRNKMYALSELKNNALRAKEKGYHDDPKRRREIIMFNKKRMERCGFYGKQTWSVDEIQFLKENHSTMSYEVMALRLNRSWMSISRKCNRLKLKKYNSWQILKQEKSNG